MQECSEELAYNSAAYNVKVIERWNLISMNENLYVIVLCADENVLHTLLQYKTSM